MADPADNASVTNSMFLLRRVKPVADSVELVGDSVRPSSTVFRDSEGQVCVSLDTAGKLGQFIANFPDAGVIRIPVSVVRDLGYTIVSDEQPDDPDHHYIYNPTDPSKCMTKPHARAMAKGAADTPPKYEWVYQPARLLDLARSKKV